MQIGDCPYEDCKGTIMAAMPDRTPRVGKYECEECNRPVWLYHSRLDPGAYTEEGFREAFEVDESTKTIRPRKEEVLNDGK